ncbi:MAG: LmbE family protein [Anaerolineaceae bacterium]|nr:MAG: LmbE family protein [Anaerolineaceae bacterium]
MTEKRLLTVFAHPDDESFRPGGTLALLAQKGARVQVLTATRGGAGSRGDPPLCSPAELPAVREAELRCACAALGLLPPILLDYQDGQLAEADPETLIAEILGIVRDLRPQIMLTFGADGLSGHPDHIAIGLAAAEAFRRVEDVPALSGANVSALYTLAVPRSLAETLGMKQIRAVPDEAIALTVDVSSVWEAKKFAIRCHRTQLGGSPILDAPEARQRLFLGTEHFCLAASRLASNGKIANLLEWLEN